MLGNFDTGCLIGLTDRGADLWSLYAADEIDGSAFSLSEPELYSVLSTHGFFEQANPRAMPVSAYIHVTSKCNLSYVGCYSRSDKELREPTLSSIEQILSFLRDRSVNRLHISGGEPFLRHDLDGIVRRSKELGFTYVDIATNGTVCTAESLSRIALCVDTVNVSLRSCKPDTEHAPSGTEYYQKVMQNVQSMLELGIDVCLLPTIHSQNVDEIPLYLDLAHKIGTRINFSILSCSARNADLGNLAFDEDSLSSLADILNKMTDSSDRMPILVAKRSCSAGTRQLSVDVNGNVYPCHMLHSPSL